MSITIYHKEDDTHLCASITLLNVNPPARIYVLCLRYKESDKDHCCFVSL